MSVDQPAANRIAETVRGAIADGNPMSSANTLLDAANTIKALLSGGSQPELMRVNRIGFALGHGLETAAIVSRGNPTQVNIDTFVAVTQKWRGSLPQDIEECGLSENLKASIRGTNVRVGSPADLSKLIDASREILTLAQKSRG